MEIYGFEVTRGKIEVPPFHPAVPSQSNNFQHEKNGYFEGHIEVLLNSDDPNSFERLRFWAQKRGDVHLSMNTFKRHGEVTTVMLTYRNDKQTMESFKKEVQLIREQLVSAGFVLNGKEILEYCLYDSSISHDNEWLFGKAG